MVIYWMVFYCSSTDFTGAARNALQMGRLSSVSHALCPNIPHGIYLSHSFPGCLEIRRYQVSNLLIIYNSFQKKQLCHKVRWCKATLLLPLPVFDVLLGIATHAATKSACSQVSSLWEYPRHAKNVHTSSFAIVDDEHVVPSPWS